MISIILTFRLLGNANLSTLMHKLFIAEKKELWFGIIVGFLDYVKHSKPSSMLRTSKMSIMNMKKAFPSSYEILQV